MPTYDYQCEACENVLEVSHGIKEAGPERCPACGKKGKMRRLISPGGGVIFKGSGFYITDYKNKPGKTEAKAGEETKTEKKTESKETKTESAKPAETQKSAETKASE